jgi:hypothetical protein
VSRVKEDRAWVLLAVPLLVLLLAGPAAAGAPSGPPPRGGWDRGGGFTLGPAFGWAGGGAPDQAFATGLELTYFHELRNPLFAWISLGGRFWVNGHETSSLPYAEAGLTFVLLNVGGGYAPRFVAGGPTAHTAHLFVGVSIPIFSPARGQFFYIEPYYRPAWQVSGGDAGPLHEVGLMLKWFWALDRGDPAEP